MSAQPPQPPKKTLLGQVTQVIRTRVNFTKMAIKANARVPQLLVQDADAPQPDTYPLVGEKYVLGRSSQSCDIVVRNEVVSTVHLSLTRDRKKKRGFILKDEGSTNGIYRGKKRIKQIELRNGDKFTLGPPELKSAVTITFKDPPSLPIRLLQYGSIGTSGIVGLTTAGILLAASQVDVTPLPDSNGPVIVYSEDLETPLRAPRTTAHIDLKNISDFSPYLPKALIASEDSRFYWHFGFDPQGMARAVSVVRSGGKQGASTITQQLARNLFRSYVGRDDSIQRKLKELVVALKLETFYSKDQLLLTYLNRVFLGIDTSGFEDAARLYFGKSARDLDLSESATLVGILPGPNIYNPCVEDKNGRVGTRAIERRNLVLGRMVETGAISQAEARAARRSRLDVSPNACTPLKNTKAPYLYGYVMQELQDVLGEELAKEGNFVIETGLNLRMQAKAEAAMRNSISGAGRSYGFNQGGIVTLDTSTGIVKAMVGGADYQKSQFNRATDAKRQPGSTFKLFAYAAALEEGISPNKTYSCDPMAWEGRSFPGCNHGASGAANMYTGFALSENVTALRVARDAGLGKTVDLAQRMGIRSKVNPIPAMVLGQDVVSMLEITGAYGAVAARGVWHQPRAILRVYDSSECQDRSNLRTCRVMYDATEDRSGNRKVLNPGIADTLTTMMRGVITNGTGKTAAIGMGEVGKTGTTNDNVDMWFVGFIPSKRVVTGVWLGNDNPVPTKGSSAQAAQTWGNYMGSVYR
jgi:membrane peptidoglycan carboxypeptidase